MTLVCDWTTVPDVETPCAPRTSTVEAIIERARQAHRPAGMPTRVIALDGPGGAGKTTLAGHLSAALGDAPVVHTDEFATPDDPREWWQRLLADVLCPLSHGHASRFRPYDWVAGRLTRWRVIEPGAFLVLEGVSASREAFRPFLSLTVWVRTAREERLRRGLARDGQGARDQWLAWMADEDAYVQREKPERNADLVVSGDGTDQDTAAFA
jgi:uridine kinase